LCTSRDDSRVCSEAQQGVSYGVPAFRLKGRTIAGFAAFGDHLCYLPHSGSVIAQLEKQTAPYTRTKSALHFSVDESLPPELVKALLDLRIAEAFGLGS
jgi:uncharacterized protein YdhG (YjbR/CyaY superfamily)